MMALLRAPESWALAMLAEVEVPGLDENMEGARALVTVHRALGEVRVSVTENGGGRRGRRRYDDNGIESVGARKGDMEWRVSSSHPRLLPRPRSRPRPHPHPQRT